MKTGTREMKKEHSSPKSNENTVNNKFTDLNSDDWYTPDILKLVEKGAINGYNDGTFKPEKKITVGEFLKLILTAVGETVEPKGSVYWYENYVKRAEELGIVEKKECYSYDMIINRAIMAKMVYKLLKLNPDKNVGVALADVNTVNMKWVNAVFNECLMRGYMEGNGHVVFRPNQAATRGEACAVIVRVLNYMENPGEYKKERVKHQEDGKSTIQYIIQHENVQTTHQIPVLLYHHILKKDENKKFKNNYSVISMEEFESNMKLLYEKGFYTVTPYEMEKFLKKEIELPYKSVMITFDDGYLSNYMYAYPILKKYGFRATVFVVSSGIFKTPQKFSPDQLNMISWEEINKSLDVFDYASHTHAMHNQINGLSYIVSKSENDVRQDLKHSKELLGQGYFSYPYGQYNMKTIQILEELGFKLAFTTKEGNVTEDSKPYELGRYYMNPGRDFEAVLKKAYPDFEKQ